MCAGARTFGAQGAQKFAGRQRVQGPHPTVIARSEATWQSASPAAGHDRKQCFGRIRESAYEFALRIANLQSFSAGTRIAAPVCALVRNDMLKTGRCQRLQGRFPAVHRRCPLANADTGQIFACHCKPVMGLSGLSRLSNEKNPGKCPAREKHTLTFSRKIDKITTYREAVRLRGFPAGSGPSPIAPPAATPDNKIRRNSL